MEEKLVINELQQGKEIANRLIRNLKHTSSSSSSLSDPNNKIMISEVLRIYQNAILMLSLPQEDNKNKTTLKRSNLSQIDNKDSSKKRKMLEKKTEKVKVFIGTGQENGSIPDDGYSWRKYGQKDIHGSTNPRGYYRCTHRFTQDCLAVKQVQRSDKDPSIYEVKYLGDHTCNNNNTSPKTNPDFSVSLFESGNRVDNDITEQPKEEETIISVEDLEYKKDIFRTFSFSNLEIENVNNIFSGNLMKNASPATSGSGVTSEIARVPGYVENSETADSYFSSLDNIIDFGQDGLWRM